MARQIQAAVAKFQVTKRFDEGPFPVDPLVQQVLIQPPRSIDRLVPPRLEQAPTPRRNRPGSSGRINAALRFAPVRLIGDEPGHVDTVDAQSVDVAADVNVVELDTGHLHPGADRCHGSSSDSDAARKVDLERSVQSKVEPLRSSLPKSAINPR